MHLVIEENAISYHDVAATITYGILSKNKNVCSVICSQVFTVNSEIIGIMNANDQKKKRKTTAK